MIPQLPTVGYVPLYVKGIDPVTRNVPLMCPVAGGVPAAPPVPQVVAAWQSEQGAFPPLVAVVTCAWCVTPVGCPPWMSVWHITQVVVFVLVLPFHVKSIPELLVVDLLLWQLTAVQVPPPLEAQTPLSSVLGSQRLYIALRSAGRFAALP